MADKKRKNVVRKPEKHLEKRPKVEKIVLQAFHESIRGIRKVTGKSGGPKLYHFTGEVLRRREAAVSAYLETVQTRWSEKYPDLNIQDEWLRLCAAMGHTVRGMDSLYHISLAGALWLLDTLQEEGKLRQAARYLPEEMESYLRLPDFCEPRYDDDTIRRMVFLLRERDEPDPIYDGYINPVAAARQEPVTWTIPEGSPEQWTNSERISALLSLIHPDLVERAAARFEEKMWEFVDRYFACIAGFVREEKSHQQNCDYYFEQCRKLGGKLGFPWWADETQKNAQPKFAMADPLNVQGAAFPPLFSDKVRRGEVKRLEAIIKTGLAEEEIIEACEDKHDSLSKVAGILPLLEGESLRAWQERYGADTARQLLEFTVDDPYEICVAFLFLVELGSDLPWLYTPAVAVLTAAVAKLPWTAMQEEIYTDENSEEDDGWEALNDEEEKEENNGDEDSEPIPEGEPEQPPDRQAEFATFYELNYTSDALFSPAEREGPFRRRNLPQLIYGITGLIMPRNIQREDGEQVKRLIQSGIPAEEAPVWERYLQLAGDLQRVDEAILELEEEEASPPEDSAGDDSAEGELTAEKEHTLLKEKIRKLEEQLSELRGTLHAAFKDSERKQAEVERVRAEAANEHQELLDLRELVFRLETGVEPELETRRRIRFPFEAKRRTVVFGGHDTWLKAIRPLLPGVNFVGREINPSADMIRRADVVWIQANALAHKRYYKIIDIVRINHIPVRYFGYASAEKCALQLAAADQEASG